MCIKREKKQHMKGQVKEKTYINIIEEKISTMYVYKWSQDLMYKNNVSKERKEKIQNILTTSLKKKQHFP